MKQKFMGFEKTTSSNDELSFFEKRTSYKIDRQ